MYYNELKYFEKDPNDLSHDDAKFSSIYWRAKYEELERTNQELRNLFNLLIYNDSNELRDTYHSELDRIIPRKQN